MGSRNLSRLSPTVLLVAATVCLVAAVGCGYFYAILYWPYRALFDPEGRFLDEATLVVYHQQNGVLLGFAVGFFLLAVLAGVAWLARRKLRSGKDAS